MLSDYFGMRIDIFFDGFGVYYIVFFDFVWFMFLVGVFLVFDDEVGLVGCGGIRMFVFD